MPSAGKQNEAALATGIQLPGPGSARPGVLDRNPNCADPQRSAVNLLLDRVDLAAGDASTVQPSTKFLGYSAICPDPMTRGVVARAARCD
jgi:hypothetical protein